MFHRTIKRLSLTLAAGLAITACNVDEGSEPVDDTLETQLSELGAAGEGEAMRRFGLPEDAGEDEAGPPARGDRPAPDGERPPRDGERPPQDGERPARPEGEGERPAPGVDPAAFCAENLDEFIAGCEARAAAAESLPEDFPGCEVIAEEVCMHRAAQAIRHRIRACHEACRPEARAVFGMCTEDGGEPEACREEAIGVAEACHEACPDAPPRPEGEGGAERPERPAPEDGAERPARPAPEDGERPQRPAPEEDGEG